MSTTTTTSSPRQAAHPIESFFLDRWSPRALVPEPMPTEDLWSLFEAARWAPSSYNNQPWRFLYARRDTPPWPLFFNLLVEQNRGWAGNAAVLVLVVSNTKFDHNGKDAPTHSFDAGAAWQNLALQAWIKGYVAHAMQGFDYKKAQNDLEIPADFKVEAMIALGRQAPKSQLPPALQERESPSPRRPILETIAEGKFTVSLLHAEKK
jgi:nitroreductase